MSNVTLTALTKTFGANFPAVQSIDLEIVDGEFLTLLGPSGCGKSTLLRMLAGLEEPTSGDIRFDDRIVTDLDPAERNVAMVFQNYALYPHMTVAQNIGYPLKKRGVAPPERNRRIAETAALLKIEQLLDRRPRQLSGGQQQRVALGRAIIRDPAVYLFDEPLSNLDAALRSYMRNELIRLHARLRGTMIFVTHDQVEAMTMSTRIAVMDRGRIQQLGTPEEIYTRPRTRFVAGFVGTPSMNFLPMDVVTKNGEMHLVCEGISIAPDLETRGLLNGSASIIAGARPEDILVGSGPFQAEIAVVEALGNEQIVTIACGGRELVTRVQGDRKHRIGEPIPFEIRTEKLHFFSPETELRLG